ncbi:MAG: hypothetical protein Q8R24_05940 [Legionellaceae bacterium]|nr:hypothetical protein [Legionellaceae bacterium]
MFFTSDESYSCGFASNTPEAQVRDNFDKDVESLKTQMRTMLSAYSTETHQLRALAHPWLHLLKLVVNIVKLLVAIFDCLLALFINDKDNDALSRASTNLLVVLKSIVLNVLNVVASFLSIITRNIVTVTSVFRDEEVKKSPNTFADLGRGIFSDMSGAVDNMKTESKDRTLDDNAFNIINEHLRFC